MKQIVTKAGFMLTDALDRLDKTKMLHPFLVAITDDNKEITYQPNELDLEITIPKVINAYEDNLQNANSATAIYPAEIVNDRGERESIIIVMIQDYKSKEYIVISQPYEIVDSKVKVSKFELLDYSPFLLDKLDILNSNFIEGALCHKSANVIWSKKIKAS